MTDAPIITFEIDFGDGGGPKPVTPEQLARFPDLLNQMLVEELGQASERLISLLKEKYNIAIHERPRDEGDSLKQRVMAAICGAVTMTKDGVFEMGVFDYERAVETTNNPDEVGRGQRSLFEIMEEGYDATIPYGFVPLDFALKQITNCVAAYEVAADKAQAEIEHVRVTFAGRHGEGIMSNVFAPLFFRFPAWGTPFEHGILPHGSWDGWNVLYEFEPGQDVGESPDNWAEAIFMRAMHRTVQRLQTL